jgi:translation initiation factor 3 subunit M
VKFLAELVKTYDVEGAGQGVGHARQLIVELLMDNQQFVFDYMLSLPAVMALKGEPLHKLLEIFVSGKLLDFKEFQTENPAIFDSLGLEFQKCLRKIQLLTLVSLATENTEVEFKCLCSELDLELESVEPTVIEAVRLDLIKATVDQVNQKIIINGAVHRTFTMDQWKTLHDKLSHLNKNIETVLRRFETLTSKT